MTANATAAIPEGTYLYGIVDQPIAPSRSPGFGPVRGISEGDVHALVTTVPLAEWEPERMATREAVADAARRHQEVLQQLLDHCTPLPMRLGTILQDDERVRQFLRRARPQLMQAMELLRGRQEWGIQLAVDRTALARHVRGQSTELRSLEDRMGDAAEGTRFMLEKRRDRLLTRLVDEQAETLAGFVRRELERTAARCTALSSRADCALNDSLLVDTVNTENLAAQVQSLDARIGDLGAIRLTGPWPPYSFAPVIRIDTEEEPADG